VAHILEGSVQKSGDSVRVNVQLIKAANDSHLWADTFDRKLTDIFSVESKVAKAIADQLRAKLTGQEEQIIAAKPTDNTEAYDAYLRGLAYTLKAGNTPANVLGAQKYLKEAVRLDPKFALAWALLSRVDAGGYLVTILEPTLGLREEARQAAETALTLQPNLGEAVVAKGFYHYACLKDYDSAVRYFEQARQFLPNSSRIPESLAYLERRRGQWDRSDSTSTKPSGSTRAMLTYSPSMLFPISPYAVFPKRCESLIRFSILRRMTSMSWPERGLSHKPKAICRVPPRSALPSIRLPTIPRLWKYKFTKRSLSAAPHQSSLG
jgi:tetratricopeptide (TPR) repeat protein